MANELAVQKGMNLSELGNVLIKSGFFQDSRDASQAIVKVLAGEELGFGPIASMTGIYVISGRITMSANLMASAIKRTKRYNYRVIELSDERCDIQFFEDGKPVGNSVFTLADARKAGTKNLDKFPRNMLFARAMSNGARWFTPDIFGGPVYTPEELGANITEDGDVIDIPAVAVKVAEKVTQAEPPVMTLADAKEVTNSKGVKFADFTTEELHQAQTRLQEVAKNAPKEVLYQKNLKAIGLILEDRESQEAQPADNTTDTTA